MVDKEVVQHKISVIEDNLAKLEILAQLSPEEFLDKFYYVESAKHLIQVSIEAMLDIAHHVIARERFRTPKTYAEALLILVEQGILPQKKEPVFLQMAKFRNRVVHLYHDVDDKEVYQILIRNLDDFRTFVGAVVKTFL
ncbi:type VII toxin-antitoxin system HepT family RNase toxin [Desulfallas thermosapovorans]|uniref:Uncharacterized protein YutE (UPF0331/DUF86 family) n=1 Tax=Desulfallas thermosapovorans DSM 6562 TaxID=1121431 RepID=A0A5S4ZP11_9FIRM|nr:DUF86 domain-containing protein [Desulfallas thermosapovorans]TYO93793.1 uncharacterized protein YutE (UPF0331/DUF86 family) [Desulfallas thermosapovorans DSM 6562]